MRKLYFPDGDFKRLCVAHIFREIYLEKVYQCLEGRKDLVIVSIGANIGLVTHYLKDFGKVYAIEPVSESFEVLKKNAEQWDNVEVFKLAISDKDGEGIMNLWDENPTGNSLTNTWEKYIPNKKSEMVKTMRMDTFFKENKIEKVDFMKLDVEGAEDMILRSEGFKNVVGKIQAIEIEFHDEKWTQLSELLIEYGFEAKKMNSVYNVILFTKII